MLYKRVISGLLFLPVFYLLVWQLPPPYLAGMIAIAAAVGQFEFYRMAKNTGRRPLAAVGIALGCALVIAGFYHTSGCRDGRALFYITLCVLMVLAGRLFSSGPVEGALEDAAVTLLGILYVALLFGFQVAIRLGASGKQWLVFLYFVIWATDIGAYSIGIPFGRHKLYPKASPKKSVEGLLGGFAAAVGMSLLCRIWFMPPVGALEAAGLALLLSATGTVGDLSESLFKRSAGIKDSGSIIPGHGGMLDRMDSMLFAAPVLYYYLGMR